jgi:hypothetical protein
MNRSFLFVSICLVLLVACDKEPTSALDPVMSENLPGISQGIYGLVLFWEGDFMPTYPEDDSGGSVYPVVRDVCIFEAVLHRDIEWTYVEIEPGIYTYLAAAIPSELVKVVKSDKEGYFEAELPPGMYSIFVRENGYYYATRVDGAGYVFPAEVGEGGTVGVKFDITYMAAY